MAPQFFLRRCTDATVELLLLVVVVLLLLLLLLLLMLLLLLLLLLLLMLLSFMFRQHLKLSTFQCIVAVVWLCSQKEIDGRRLLQQHPFVVTAVAVVVAVVVGGVIIAVAVAAVIAV